MALGVLTRNADPTRENMSAPNEFWCRMPFTTHVRRLEAIGLTESLEIGYWVTPRNQSLLAAIAR